MYSCILKRDVMNVTLFACVVGLVFMVQVHRVYTCACFDWGREGIKDAPLSTRSYLRYRCIALEGCGWKILIRCNC